MNPEEHETISIKDETGWGNLLRNVAVNQGVGWVFLGAILWAIYVQAPAIIEKLEVSRQTQANHFAESVKEVLKMDVEAANIRTKSVNDALEAFRMDEREDRRLFVEILKRSDLTPQELQDAIEAATDSE